MRAPITCWGSKPGSTARTLAKLRVNSPAPVTSTSANATWATTRALPIACVPRPAEAPRPRIRIETEDLPPSRCATGSNPTNKAKAAAMIAVYSSTWRSSPNGRASGRSCAVKWLAAPSPLQASRRPHDAPRRVSSALSTSNCRAMAPRLAPSARRMANSPLLALERARRRLATLTQPISSKKSTPPCSR